MFLRHLLSAGPRPFWHFFCTLQVVTSRIHLSRVSESESWIKPFRRQIAETCGDSWYVRNNRGRIRLVVRDAGTGSLPFEWTSRGSAIALARIQQIFKLWNS